MYFPFFSPRFRGQRSAAPPQAIDPEFPMMDYFNTDPQKLQDNQRHGACGIEIRRQGKKEITLGCISFDIHQPRVTSVHSYYLTSLVNLSFCGIPHFLQLRQNPRASSQISQFSVLTRKPPVLRYWDHLYMGTTPLKS